MKKELPIVCLNLSKVIAFLNLIFLISCQSKEEREYNHYANYFKKEHQFLITDKINSIFILTENGCLPCNRKFSNLLSELKNKDSTLILIMASGTMVNISIFDLYPKNVIFAKNANSEKYYEFLQETKAIFISKNKIDTTLVLEAQNLESQFSEIGKRTEIGKISF